MAEPASTVSNPPIRSEISPQNWRVTKAVPSTTESMAALCVGAMPRSVQKATRWLCGMAMGTQHMKAAAATRANIVLGRKPRTAALWSEPEPAGERHHDRDLHHRIRQHAVAPPIGRDRALENGRPHRARDVGAARDQRQGRAAPAIEPSAHIDVERRVEPGIAEHAHEQPMPDIERQARAERRDREPDRDHGGAENDRPTDAEAHRQRSHRDAAEPRAEPGERSRERGNRPLAAGVGRHGLEADRDDPQPTERERQGDERDRRDHPRIARLDAGLIRARRGEQRHA